MPSWFTAGFDQLADAVGPAQQRASSFYNNEFITPSTQVNSRYHRAAATTSPAQRRIAQAYCTIRVRTKMRAADVPAGAAVHGRPPTRNSTLCTEIVAVRLRRRGIAGHPKTYRLYPEQGPHDLEVPAYSDRAVASPDPGCVTYLKALGANAVDCLDYRLQAGISLNSACRSRGWWHRSKRAARNSGSVLALPIDKINKILDRRQANDEAAGMGSGTETYLAGSDNSECGPVSALPANPENTGSRLWRSRHVT